MTVAITNEQLDRLLASITEATRPTPAPAPAQTAHQPLWELSESELSGRLRESVSAAWSARTGARTMWD